MQTLNKIMLVLEAENEPIEKQNKIHMLICLKKNPILTLKKLGSELSMGIGKVRTWKNAYSNGEWRDLLSLYQEKKPGRANFSDEEKDRILEIMDNARANGYGVPEMFSIYLKQSGRTAVEVGRKRFFNFVYRKINSDSEDLIKRKRKEDGKH